MTSQQQWNSDEYLEHANFVPTLGNPVLELLNPSKGERILDLGCGDGDLTLKISNICDVVGIDSSDSMIKKAKDRGLDAHVVSGEKLSYENEFDAVFTNAALHWMKNYGAVLEGVSKALKSGGRFIGEFGGNGNIHHLLTSIKVAYEKNPEFGELTIPWFFPTVDFYKKALSDHGFDCTYIELIPRPTPLQSGARKWLEIFSDFAVSKLSDEQKEIFFTECETYLKDHIYSDKGGWVADYVRLRFSATKKD